jgi:hypothetical protein
MQLRTIAIDSISYTAAANTPEPSTLVMLIGGAGTAAVGLYRRRKQRAAG